MKNEGPNKGLEWTNLILGICCIHVRRDTCFGMECGNRRHADCVLLRYRTLLLWGLGRMVQSHPGLLGRRSSVPARLRICADSNMDTCRDRAKCRDDRHRLGPRRPQDARAYENRAYRCGIGSKGQSPGGQMLVFQDCPSNAPALSSLRQ